MQKILLWLAVELLKIAGGAAVRKALPYVLSRMDSIMPAALRNAAPQFVESALFDAFNLKIGRQPNPVEQTVIRMFSDPVICAKKQK